MSEHKTKRIVITRIIVELEGGEQKSLSLEKVMLVDRETKLPLFQEVLEQKEQ